MRGFVVHGMGRCWRLCVGYMPPPCLSFVGWGGAGGGVCPTCCLHVVIVCRSWDGEMLEAVCWVHVTSVSSLFTGWGGAGGGWIVTWQETRQQGYSHWSSMSSL